MDEITIRRKDIPYLVQGLGLVILLVSWLTTWLVVPLFFGISIEGGFWGASFESGGNSEWGSWFHENWADADGVMMAGIGSILGGAGFALVLGTIVVHFTPSLRGKDWARFAPLVGHAGAVAILVGCLMVRGGMVTALDGNVEASDWASGFWFAWVASALLVGTSVFRIAKASMSASSPESQP